MIKLIQSNYDKESGCAYVKIATDLGHFSGLAWLNLDEDKEIESEFFGCDLAEARAMTYYYERKKELLGHKLDALYRFRTDLKRNPQYNSESFEVEILNKRISQMENQNRLYKIEIANLKKYVEQRPVQRCKQIEAINKFLEEKKNQKENQDNE